MKPIFNEEINFLKNKGIDIPFGCWKDGSKIYLTPYDSTPLLVISVLNNDIVLRKDNRENLSEYNTINIEEIIEREKTRVLQLESEAIEFLNAFEEENKNTKTILAYSGGKDSDVLLEIAKKSKLKFVANWANTSNETSETYLHVKKRIGDIEHNYMNPKEGYYQWIKRKNYLIPTRLMRNCCSTYKEGQLKKYYDKDKELIQITGVRKLESIKRSKYQKIMDYDFDTNLRGSSNMPKLWKTLAPIVEWSDLDIWVYLFMNNISFNKQYKYGFERCGCLICPYQSDYTDLLIEYFYPKMWNRWVNNILKNSFEKLCVKENFKYDFDEWINHKWKSGISKEYEIIQLKATPERIKELAELKGISEDIAKKYFKNACKECLKRLNPNEVGMNLKYFGREFPIENMICKKCFCKKMDMKQVTEFRNSGCNLF